tara:strand:+ start:11949 stop:12956 length:1008 start_codon:yes stop_codon:yes gene_type:complete
MEALHAGNAHVNTARILHDARTFFAHLLGTEHFAPASLPVPSSLMRRDFTFLEKNAYFVGKKHDGVRCALLLGVTATHPRITYTALINRAGTIHLVLASASSPEWPPELHRGTLLDCELLACTPKKGGLIVFDAFAVSGYDVRPCDIAVRMRHAKAAVEKIRQIVTPQPFNSRSRSKCTIAVALKHFEQATPESVKKLWSSVDKKDEPSDGVVFAPRNKALETGRMPTYFKFKPSTKHTIDLLFSKETLTCSNGDHLPPNVDVDCDGLSDAGARKGIVEVAVSRRGERVGLSFVTNRDDKTNANSRFVVDRTIRNLFEGLTIDDVSHALKDSPKF